MPGKFIIRNAVEYRFCSNVFSYSDMQLLYEGESRIDNCICDELSSKDVDDLIALGFFKDIPVIYDYDYSGIAFVCWVGISRVLVVDINTGVFSIRSNLDGICGLHLPICYIVV